MSRKLRPSLPRDEKCENVTFWPSRCFSLDFTGGGREGWGRVAFCLIIFLIKSQRSVFLRGSENLVYHFTTVSDFFLKGASRQILAIGDFLLFVCLFFLFQTYICSVILELHARYLSLLFMFSRTKFRR